MSSQIFYFLLGIGDGFTGCLGGQKESRGLLYIFACKWCTYKAVRALMCGKRTKGPRKELNIWGGLFMFFFLIMNPFQQQNIYTPVKKMDKGLEYTVLQSNRQCKWSIHVKRYHHHSSLGKNEIKAVVTTDPLCDSY